MRTSPLSTRANCRTRRATCTNWSSSPSPGGLRQREALSDGSSRRSEVGARGAHATCYFRADNKECPNLTLYGYSSHANKNILMSSKHFYKYFLAIAIFSIHLPVTAQTKLDTSATTSIGFPVYPGWKDAAITHSLESATKIDAIAFSPDGQLLATVGGGKITICSGYSVFSSVCPLWR